ADGIVGRGITHAHAASKVGHGGGAGGVPADGVARHDVERAVVGDLNANRAAADDHVGLERVGNAVGVGADAVAAPVGDGDAFCGVTNRGSTGRVEADPVAGHDVVAGHDEDGSAAVARDKVAFVGVEGVIAAVGADA